MTSQAGSSGSSTSGQPSPYPGRSERGWTTTTTTSRAATSVADDFPSSMVGMGEYTDYSSNSNSHGHRRRPDSSLSFRLGTDGDPSAHGRGSAAVSLTVPGVRPGGPPTELQQMLQRANSSTSARGVKKDASFSHNGKKPMNTSTSGISASMGGLMSRRPSATPSRGGLTRSGSLVELRPDCADALSRKDESVDGMVQPLMEKVARDLGRVGRIELWYSRRPQGVTAGPLQLVAQWMDPTYVLPMLGQQECHRGVKGAISYLSEETQAWTSPGSGLAGVLYTEAEQALHGVRWRRLMDMAVDPLLPYDRRTIHTAKLFKYAGGIQLPDGHGVMLVLTKHPYSPDSPEPACLLNSALPVITSAAQGLHSVATLAAHGHRHSSPSRLRASQLWSMLRSACLGGHWSTSMADGGTSVKLGMAHMPVSKSMMSAVSHADSGADGKEDGSCLGRWLATYGAKALGAGGTPAPMGSWTNFGWTFGGVFFCLLITSIINQAVLKESDDLFFLVGSLGALNTLMFAIPNAPLVQPRNVIFGNGIGAVVAILFTYISSPAFYVLIPQSVAVALAPAAAIALMGKFGVVHPPGGAACLIYISAAQGSKVVELGWMYLFMPVLTSAVLTIIVGILWNNLSSSRQYPIYW